MLILNGGSSGEKIKNSYELFSKQIGKGKVLYIPLAWNNGPYEECIDWFREEIKPYGITNIEMITEANQLTIEKLNEANGIFIGGGNTFKLLKLLKDSVAFENLKKFAKHKDKVIMGASAGTLIFGNKIDACEDDGLDIKSCGDINDVGLKDTTGFNLVNDYSLFVHYKKKEAQINATKLRIKKMIDKGLKLICIPDETSLIVVGNKGYVLGNKPIEIFENEKSLVIAANQEIQL